MILFLDGTIMGHMDSLLRRILFVVDPLLLVGIVVYETVFEKIDGSLPAFRLDDSHSLVVALIAPITEYKRVIDDVTPAVVVKTVDGKVFVIVAGTNVVKNLDGLTQIPPVFAGDKALDFLDESGFPTEIAQIL